jgi:hypothetical protein
MIFHFLNYKQFFLGSPHYGKLQKGALANTLVNLIQRDERLGRWMWVSARREVSNPLQGGDLGDPQNIASGNGIKIVI